MRKTKMHADEIVTDVALVRRLLHGQFPQWADLPIDPVASYGTDHDIYRLGDHLAARLPRIAWATQQAAKEAAWLPRLAPHLPLALPGQLALGRPAEGYPFDWSVYEWLPGAYANGTISNLDQAAVDLAAFVHALREIDTTGAHPRPPGGPKVAKGKKTATCSCLGHSHAIFDPSGIGSGGESHDPRLAHSNAIFCYTVPKFRPSLP